MWTSGWLQLRVVAYVLACVLGAVHATLREDYWQSLLRISPDFPLFMFAMGLLFGFPFVVFVLCGPLFVVFQFRPQPDAPSVSRSPFERNDPRFVVHFAAHVAIAEGIGFLIAAKWTNSDWAWLGGILIGCGINLLLVVRLIGAIFRKWGSNRG